MSNGREEIRTGGVSRARDEIHTSGGRHSCDEIHTGSFVENSRSALGDVQLQRALSLATGRFVEMRRLAVSSVGDDWPLLRERARAIKRHAIEHLDHYLDEFAANVTRLGGKVFWARDAAEAASYIVELARSRGVKVAVKGKSMMTEEIDLNHALSEAGVEPVETDLGEFIVQLAGERPSHLIAPVIHKTRAQIADLFAEKLGVPRTEDIGEMTALARRVLRGRFAEAGLGITGANFGVAETGTIVLLENEGNIRFSTSLPRVHVALMGIEKVIPRFEDLGVFLRLLPRSATGQGMSAYVSMLSGTKRSPSDEHPEELHVVILDNGRTGILANEHLRESLWCIRCGACLNTCPVYQKIGGHAYGWVYGGPIGSVLTPQLVGRERASDLPFASSLCGACRDVCPIGINIPDMLLQLRHEIIERPELPGAPFGETQAALERAAPAASPLSVRSQGRVAVRWRVSRSLEHVAFLAWAMAMRGPRRYAWAARMGRMLQALLGSRGLAPLVRAWTSTRELPPLAPVPFRDQWQDIERKPHVHP